MISPRVVCVLGMHRAGTSALTKALSALGVGLSENLAGPNAGNPKGHFEDMDIRILNDELLGSIGLEWHSLGLINAEELSISRHQEIFEKVSRILKSHTSRFPLWGFKDPRTARTLPFWQQVFERLDLPVVYVISIRNPLSVARSLQSRDSFPVSWSLMMWLHHYFTAFVHTEGKPRLVVDYDLLLADPERQLQRIAALLNVNLDQCGKETRKEYSQGFLDRSLRHSAYSREETKMLTSLYPQLVEFYDRALVLAKDEAPQESFGEGFLQQTGEMLKSGAMFLNLLEELRAERTKLFHIVAKLKEYLATPRSRLLLSLRLLPRWMQRLSDGAERK